MRKTTTHTADGLDILERKKRHHSRQFPRAWTVVAALVVGVGIFLVLAAPKLRIWNKARNAQQMLFESVPASERVTLAPGTACIIRLPNQKSVALWCNKATGLLAALHDSELMFEYGEQPFTSLKLEVVSLPGGMTTQGEYLSYIRQGPVITSSNGSEYVLYVDAYCLSIVAQDSSQNKGALPLVVSARLANEKELVSPKQEREHYLQALRSNDPKQRSEAIHELGMMVAMGSIYAGNPREIADALRPFLKDPDEGVRSETMIRLRVMGDEDALVEMLTPRPVPEFAEPNGAWTIAGWCRKDSQRVPQHVLTYFATDDPKLHEFALAFFSCFGDSNTPAQPFVVKYLSSDVPEVRAAAASAIRFACDRQSAESLLQTALADKSDKVLVEALKGVSDFTNDDLTNRVVALLASASSEVRLQAAHALASCRNSVAVEQLLIATRDDEPRVRGQAAVSLGRLGDAKGYDRLLDLLRDESPDVRESALNGLRWMRKKNALKAVTELAETDPNESVREMARRCLRELEQM